MEKEAIRSYSSSERLSHVIRLWLMLMLIVIPYQTEILNHVGPWSEKLTRTISLLDEITIVVFFLPALLTLCKGGSRCYPILLILQPLCFFGIAGLLSGVTNGNSMLTTSYGIFYYIKYFLLIFIYAVYFKTFSQFKTIFRYALIIAVIAGFVAFIHEIWAILFRYVFEQNSTNELVHAVNAFLSKLTLDDLQNNLQVRMGLYRTTSLMSHFNLLGFYSLLILTIYLYTEKKVNAFFCLCILSGIYFSMSRVAIVGFIVLGLLQAMRGKKWLVFFIILPICVLFYWGSILSESLLDDTRVVSDLVVKDLQNVDGSKTYRQYAKGIAIDIWRDHPYFGVGPGMFGGAIAKKINSPYYEEYNFSIEALRHYSDLDQFWPQALAETGIAGTGFFASFYLYVFLVIVIAIKRASFDDLKNYLTGLMVLSVFILINTLASSLNIVSILYSYCAFVGIGLSFSFKTCSSSKLQRG